MAFEARRRRKEARGLKCEMKEGGIRTEARVNIRGEKKDVNAIRNKLWSASLAMSTEEREEASSGEKLVRTYRRLRSVLSWAEGCFLSTPSSSLVYPVSLALPFRSGQHGADPQSHKFLTSTLGICVCSAGISR